MRFVLKLLLVGLLCIGNQGCRSTCSEEEPVVFDIVHVYGGPAPVVMRLTAHEHSVALVFTLGPSYCKRISNESDLAAIEEILDSKEFRELAQRPVPSFYDDEIAIIAAHGLKSTVSTESTDPTARSLFVRVDRLFSKSFGREYIRPFASERR